MSRVEKTGGAVFIKTLAKQNSSNINISKAEAIISLKTREKKQA